MKLWFREDGVCTAAVLSWCLVFGVGLHGFCWPRVFLLFSSLCRRHRTYRYTLLWMCTAVYLLFFLPGRPFFRLGGEPFLGLCFFFGGGREGGGGWGALLCRVVLCRVDLFLAAGAKGGRAPHDESLAWHQVLPTKRLRLPWGLKAISFQSPMVPGLSHVMPCHVMS